jgi:hypothetical protein
MDHLGDWRDLWSKAGEVAARCCPNGQFKTREQREAFEFLRPALVYHRNCLDALDPIRLHEKLRPIPQRLTTDNTLLRMNDPLFRTLTDADYKMTWGPFLASAAVRVAAGVVAASKINRKSIPYTFVRPKSGKLYSEWKRQEAEQRGFSRVIGLGHCGDRPLGSTPDEILGHAGVIMLVHRDNFGHGEEGVGGLYQDRREGVLNDLHVCRLLEAQRVLIRWCLDQFR